jgi:phage baseplate assembly protein W
VTSAALTADAPRPIGIRTPLRFGREGEGIFSMHTSLISQIEDNFRNMILTNAGERLGLYNFGANLQPLMTEIINRNEDFEAEALERIRRTTSTYMPFIQLESFSSRPVFDGGGTSNVGRVQIEIRWGVPTLNVRNRLIRVNFFVI